MSKSFSDQTGLFKDETVLYDEWTPEELPEREEELDKFHDTLAPAARGACPHNTFIYGKTGQGKTAGVNHKLRDLKEYAKTDDDLDLTTINYSCAKDNTSYQLVCNLVQEMTGDKPWGISEKEVFDHLYSALENIGGTVIIVLDEIDNIGTDDDILYELPRARANGHLKDVYVSIVGISNDFEFRDNLSPKVKDTLRDDGIHFAPYDADQLKSILERRAQKAFKDGVLETGVIELCAALAARDKGSARQAIRYLHKAGELASNYGEESVSTEYVREAEEKIERKNLKKGIRDLTTQDHLALMGLLSLSMDEKTPARTKQVYGEYKRMAKKINVDTIALRRVRDHLQDLSLAGIASSKTKTGGREGGARYVWELDVDIEMTVEVLDEIERFDDAMDIVNTSTEVEWF